MTDTYPLSEATRLKRHPERGSYDRVVVHAILDEALVCHLAYAHDAGVFAMPTVFVRDGDTLYVHGASANRSLDALIEGAPFSLTVTLIDGVVFARSAFRHSMNYRSVIILGRVREVSERHDKRAAMARLVDRLSVGRDATLRPMRDAEIDATRVLSIDIEHASAKVRNGGPVEPVDDRAHPVWAGVVPLRTVAGAPVPDGAAENFAAPPIPACFGPGAAG
ncbi:MAG: pyridoxamine 5'-phosphate oxidase family protein [Deltaproteobacteria bacterium]